MSKYVDIKKIFARILDPVHIGAGGYRLGRVDNTIVRDPATDLPKIPGTSIAGIVREFYILYLMEQDDQCKRESDDNKKRICAENKAKTIFGDESRKGTLRFYDGEIIFFPVSSIQGTVWITTKELLEYWFGELNDENGRKIILPQTIDEDKVYALKDINSQRPLNLGWILVESANNGRELSLPKEINNYLKRIVIVSERLFSHIVSDNLEVRTSVRIDPETGTAKEGALFTYEAIPRGTIIGFEVGLDKSRNNSISSKNKVIESVSSYFKLLGIGGMGTRGFGRLEIVHHDKDDDNDKGGKKDDKS